MEQSAAPRTSLPFSIAWLIRIVLWIGLTLIAIGPAINFVRAATTPAQLVVHLITGLIILGGVYAEIWIATQPGLRNAYQLFQRVLFIQFIAFVILRIFTVLAVEQAYGPEIWMRFAISGLIIGSVYALIAIGYTLVYGILFMINFAHGDVMMIGAFAGYFIFEGLGGWILDPAAELSFLNAYPILSIILAFAGGMLTSMMVGIALERIAYRPLRAAPRLVPLISAIGASIFLEETARLMFGSQTRPYQNPDLLTRGKGIDIVINQAPVRITYTGIFVLILAMVLLAGLYFLVQRTKLGRAMRAVAQDKKTAALMGVDVDQVISRTFAISGLLAGAAGVMWGIHNGQVDFFMGFVPGIKAFTSAVLGGIGNLPGAMVGALLLGVTESVGPAGLGLDFQLKDVIGFSILVLMLIFRPTGLLGEALSEEKV